MLKFILRHRKGNVFNNVPYWRIVCILEQHRRRNTLHVVTNNTNHITGMVIAVPLINTLEIEQIICSTKQAFRSLREICRQVYPAMDLSYFRHGKRKVMSAKFV